VRQPARADKYKESAITQQLKADPSLQLVQKHIEKFSPQFHAFQEEHLNRKVEILPDQP